MNHSAITDTGYAEQVLRKGQEFAQDIRSMATDKSDHFADAILAITRAIVADAKAKS